MASDARKASGPAGLEFMRSEVELPEGQRILVTAFAEDVEQARRIANDEIKPLIAQGKTVLLDFKGTRFVTQSFVHALLHEVFRMDLSLVRLVFLNCTGSTEESIRAVAAYAASYRQIKL